MDPRVLFVHPYNHLLPQVIPVGAIGAINLLEKKATGRYAHLVTGDDLEQARVILLDVHWFFSLPAIAPMVKEYRRLAPRAKIVVGGLTASFYHEIIFDRFDLDYVLIGDVEVSFRTLMEHLLEGETPPSLPNVATCSERRPQRERIPQRLFDELDWITIDWFPAHQEQVLLLHSAPDAKHRGWGDAYPLLPLSRGCVRRCEFCYGAFQDDVFGDGVLRRSPERLLEDLLHIEASPELNFVTLYFGDAQSIGRYERALTKHRFSLDGYAFFCGVPDPDDLRMLREAFDGRVVYSIIQPSDLHPPPSSDPGAGESEALEEMVAQLRSDDRASAIWWYTSQPHPSAVEAEQGCSRLVTSSGIDWNAKRPNALELGDQRDLDDQLSELELSARCTAAALLLKGVVPTLMSIPVQGVGSEVVNNPLIDFNCDDFEKELARQSISNLTERGFLGFDDLRLEWGCLERAGQTARWAHPGDHAPGECGWRFGPRGLEWSGELELGPDEEVEVTVSPIVIGERGEETKIAEWPRALVPSVPVGRGPRRQVKVGGRLLGDSVEVWVNDRGRVRRWMLDPVAVLEERGGAEVRRANTSVLFLHVRDPFFTFDSSIAALAGVAKSLDVSFSVLSIPLGASVDDVVGQIISRDPTVVAATFPTRFAPGFRTAFARLRLHGGPVTVVGGVHTTVRPREINLWDGVDAICIGEGERPFAHLIRAVGRGAPLRTVPGLWVRGPDGWAGEPPAADPEPNICDNPKWAYEAFDDPRIPEGRSGMWLASRASRGCPFSCGFCTNRAWQAVHGRTGQRRSDIREVGSLCEELAALRDRYEIGGFSFWDPLFPVDRSWLTSFSTTYAREVGVPFRIAMHPKLARPAVLELLADAGCSTIWVGIEVGNERFRRDVLRKRASDHDIHAAFRELRRVGMRTGAWVMWDLPGETAQHVRETIDFIRDLSPDQISVDAFWPLPATPLGDALVPAMSEPAEQFVGDPAFQGGAQHNGDDALALKAELDSLMGSPRHGPHPRPAAPPSEGADVAPETSQRFVVDLDTGSDRNEHPRLVAVELESAAIVLSFELPELRKVIVEPLDDSRPFFLRTEHLQL